VNKTHVIDGVEVTLMDANHCPGAAILLFKVDDSYYLHTGDFRFHSSMKSYAPLQGIKIKGLFLDNTFCDPKYVFPPQHVAIQSIVNTVKQEVLLPILI
jgi:DNA cross-link repair 1A protein